MNIYARSMEILEKYFDEYGFAPHQFDSFNEFVNFGITNIIDDEPHIYTSFGNCVSFHNVRIEKPTVNLNSKTKCVLYPSLARKLSITYEFTVKIDVHYGKEIHKGVQLCTIPAMVGSVACNLYGKTEDEKISLGEIVDDPGGYFVINGKERIIIAQCRKLYNKHLVTKINDNFVCEMRSFSEETAKSSLISVKLCPKKTKFTVTVDRTSMNLSKLFMLLGTLDQVETFIGEDHFCLKEIVFWMKREKKFCGDNVSQFDVSQLFPHLGHSSNILKSIVLGKMVRAAVMVQDNILKTDIRSNIKFQRADSVGVLCRDLFKMLLKQFIKSISKEVEKRKVGSILPIINIKRKNISINIQHCFATGTWGIKKNLYKKDGVSEFTQFYTSLLQKKSALKKISKSVGKKDKNMKIRQLDQSSIFFWCPFETPEGAQVGTRLSLTITCTLSTQMPTILLYEILVKFKKQLNVEHIENCEETTTQCSTKNRSLSNKEPVVLLNGFPIFYSYNLRNTMNELYALRNKFVIRKDVSISFDELLNVIEIWADSGRFIRPILNARRISDLKPEMSISEMERLNILVYRDPTELETCEVAMVREEISDTTDYLEIDPCCMMGVVSNQFPFSNHIQSPRLCYMSNMVKQAIGVLPTLENRTDCTLYTMYTVQKPINRPRLADILGYSKFPNGINAVVAVMCYEGFNQEDSVIINRASLNRGMFIGQFKKTIFVDVKSQSSYEEIVCVPDESIRVNLDYSKLDDNGVVKVGSTIVKGDVIVGKIYKQKNSENKYEDKSVSAKANEEGTVINVMFTSSAVKIVITNSIEPEIGDKFCSGMAQKGTCGLILNEEDMPFCANGTIPDILINPHCLPSRMTINQSMSTICAKARCVGGNPIFENGSPFQSEDIVAQACRELESFGLAYDGTETMYNGTTGRKFVSKIFVGVVNYHQLTHRVSNKIFSSMHANVKNKLTRQPLDGRSNDGGLRVGEMEKDNLLRHGTVKFTNERMLDLSDKYILNICNTCKDYYHVSFSKGYYNCTACNSIDIYKIKMPYAAKLLSQELESLGLNVSFNINETN